MAKLHSVSLEILEGRSPLAAQSVHRVRKDLKRARARLRLLRDAVGKLAYARENASLRDAARPLAALRDADVLAATAARVPVAKWKREPRPTLTRHEVQDIINRLVETNDRVSRWRLPLDPWPVMRSGLERIYRKGRKALAVARARGTDRSLHELRKQVKYLGAALDILHFTRFDKRTDAIAEALGDDHDLMLLRWRLGYVDRELIARIDRRRGKLQKRALKDARRLYRRKPRNFIGSLE